MGRFVDVGKGSKRRPEDREKVLENLEKAFGAKKVQSGSFRQDPETGKFISAYDWHKKYGKKKLADAPYIIGDIEPYQSPIDDSYIGSRRAQRYDLQKNGCRIYEGREQEQKVADAYRAEKEARFDRTIEEGLKKTANDLKYQNIKKETRIKSSWLIGED